MSTQTGALAFVAAVSLGLGNFLLAGQETEIGMRVRIELLKKSSFESQAGVLALLGSQPTLELEWRVSNPTGTVLQIPSPPAVLAIRMSRDGEQFPVRTDWASEMNHRERIGNDIVPRTLPVGPIALASGSSVWVRGSTKRLDGAAFQPGEYLITLDGSAEPGKPQGGRIQTLVDAGTPIRLLIRDLDTPERLRQFHLLEAAFHGSSGR